MNFRKFYTKKVIIPVAILVVVFLIFGFYWINLLRVTHSSFENYYNFRGCVQLLEKTDTYGTCKLSSGETIKLVKYQDKWFLDGDIPYDAVPPVPVACTMEAKICSDGSAVDRQGPNCEFAACPSVATSTDVVSTNGNIILAIGQKGKVGSLNITLNSFVQDSRCPIDVVCIQAGSVTVNVTLTDTSHSVTKNFISNEDPYSFGGYKVSISSVNPSRGSQKDISINQYRLTFHVVSDALPTPKSSGIVSGKVTLSPICPVERVPPDPQCAPKPYSTSIYVFSMVGNKLIKTIKSDAEGNFTVTLAFGDYKIQAAGGNSYPRCGDTAVSVKTASTVSADISCDTGIR